MCWQAPSGLIQRSAEINRAMSAIILRRSLRPDQNLTVLSSGISMGWQVLHLLQNDLTRAVRKHAHEKEVLLEDVEALQHTDCLVVHCSTARNPNLATFASMRALTATGVGEVKTFVQNFLQQWKMIGHTSSRRLKDYLLACPSLFEYLWVFSMVLVRVASLDSSKPGSCLSFICFFSWFHA